mgnify:CR=1 FL=1
MMSTKTVEFIKQYKEYAKIESSICNFYRNTIGSCSQCPLNPLSCGTFDFTRVPIENLVEVLDKWRNNK